MTLKLKKFKNNQLAVFDDKAKKFVPLRGDALEQSYKHVRSDIREYFDELGRKELLYAANVVLKEEE